MPVPSSRFLSNPNELKFCQYFRPTLSNSNGMFKMRRQSAVLCYRSPTILQNPDGGSFFINHGLDRENHPSFQLYPSSGQAVIGHLRTLVQVLSNTVTDKVTYYRKAFRFNIYLHRA